MFMYRNVILLQLLQNVPDAAPSICHVSRVQRPGKHQSTSTRLGHSRSYIARSTGASIPLFPVCIFGICQFLWTLAKDKIFLYIFSYLSIQFPMCHKAKTPLVTLDSSSPSLNVSSVAKVVWCGVPCPCLSDTFLWDKRHDFVDGSPAHNNTLTYQP